MDNQPIDKTLQRLLGPAEPELLCDECFEKLDQYVELELQDADADERIPGMRAHLVGCPACHEEYESLRALVRDRSRTADSS
jgi:anti-sigma factor RsiW